MAREDKLAPLEIELKKADTLGGEIALVVVPEKYAARALTAKRDMDTAIRFKDHLVIAMFGAGTEESSAVFLSIPRGVSVFPRDGRDVKTLLYVALERLRSINSTPWVRSLWDNLSETRQLEKKQNPETRFISGSFYQFYDFIAEHPRELADVLSGMTGSEEQWVKDILPQGMMRAVAERTDCSLEQADAMISEWQYQRRMNEKLEKGSATLRRFRNMENLFTLPVVSRQIMDMAASTMFSAPEIARVVEKDPVLTSKVLKVVNSAFYGFHRQIDSVEQAVVILGNEEVMNLAFTIAICRSAEILSGREARSLWEHSIAVGGIARWLGPKIGTAREAAYTAGLLHDLGKIVLMQCGLLLNDAATVSTLKSLAREEIDAGLSHAEMGAYIAERWNLPEEIVDGLKNHHLPVKSSRSDVCLVVHLADCIAHRGVLELDCLNSGAVRVLREKRLELSPAEVAKVSGDMRLMAKSILED